MKKYLIALGMLVLCHITYANEEVKECPKKEVEINMDKVSETLGHLLIKQLNNPVCSFNIDKIIEGMKHALSGETAPLTETEYEEQILAIQEKIFQKTSEKNLSDAVSFLEKNQKEAGVVTLTEKLQYKILQEGQETTEITSEMKPLIHYTGKLLDGTVFASSRDSNNPITLSLKETIAGFSKGLLGMKKGEKRILYIHPELAYGMASHLPPNSLLVFEVEILETNVLENDPSLEEKQIEEISEEKKEEAKQESQEIVQAPVKESAKEVHGRKRS